MKFLSAILLLCLPSTSPGTSLSALGLQPDRLFDQYGAIHWNDEKARLDNFAIQLQHDETLIGFILVYDAVGGCPGEALARAIRAKRYVVEHRGVPWNRVIWRHEGQLEGLSTVLQPVPRRASLPSPMFPNVDGKPGLLTKSCRMKIRQIQRSRW